ncbi:MAG: tetratricopeptide repeat protein [Xanthobacteraceae bacterium]|nr:tetratricopeptide repeat protein [Xanthobacteraceae bacterium]
MKRTRDLDALFRRGLTAHQSSRFQEAISCYNAILKIVPGHPATLHFLGLCNIQQGNDRRGIEQILEALSLRPDYLEARYNLATALHGLGRREEAAAQYKKALSIDDKNADAHNNLGALLLELGQPDEAVGHFEAALKLQPKDPKSHSNLAVAMLRLRRYSDALDHCNHALAARPNDAEILSNRGSALLELGRHGEALDCFDAAVSLRAGLSELQIGRGNALAKLGRSEEALNAFDQAIAENSEAAEAWVGRGNVLQAIGRMRDAQDAFNKAISADPKLPQARLGLGRILARSNRQKALEELQTALAIDPALAEAWVASGDILSATGRMDDAICAYQNALRIRPDIECVHGNLLHARLRNCDWSTFESDRNRSMSDVRNGILSTDPWLFLNVSRSPEEQRQCADLYATRFFPKRHARLWNGERYSHDRIRIAYLSADFREHPVAHSIVSLFEEHDRGRFEVSALSLCVDDHSEIRKRIALSCELFQDVGNKTDDEVAELIRANETDIVVDLGGFTQGCRPGIVAARPAPISVSYLGFAATMGVDYIDYILADDVVIPQEDRRHFAEKVIALPHSYMIADARKNIRAADLTRRQVGLPDDGFVFCSFNNTYKINPGIFDVWMRLLRAVDGSVLWLRSWSATAVENLRREAAARGVAPERLVFAPAVSIEEHLGRHRLADLALDTLPYNAHTTAIDALSAGLPLLTCVGSTFASRASASMLRAIGMPELIGASLEDYERQALRLAQDASWLESTKLKLAANIALEPLFDTKRFARDVESAYTAIWERQRQGHEPAAFREAGP